MHPPRPRRQQGGIRKHRDLEQLRQHRGRGRPHGHPAPHAHAVGGGRELLQPAGAARRRAAARTARHRAIRRRHKPQGSGGLILTLKNVKQIYMKRSVSLLITILTRWRN